MLSNILVASTFALGVFAQRSSIASSSVIVASSSSSPASGSAGPTVSAQTTIDIFLGPGGRSNIQYEGSVVGVNGCDTTLALACTKGSACADGIEATITYGNSMYQATNSLSSSGIVEQLSISCALKGTTEAACTETISAQSGKVHTHLATSKTFKGAAVQFGQVPVTAGASLLSSGTCSSGASGVSSTSSSPGASTSSTSAAVSSTSGAASSSKTGSAATTTKSSAAAPTGISEVYKVLVVQGAAALLAAGVFA